MLTEGRVRAIAAQVASAIVAKIKPSVSEEQIRSDVEAVLRAMKEAGELEGGTVTDEQIFAAVEKYLTEHPIESPEVEKAAESARKSAEEAEASVGEAQAAADEAGESARTAEQSASSADESASLAASSAEAAAANAERAGTANTAAEKAASDALEHKEAVEKAKNEVEQKLANGDYKGKDGYTPVPGVDYPTDAQIDTKIAAALAERNQLEPLSAESVDWLNVNGDPTKIYIVPNEDRQGGKVYACVERVFDVSGDVDLLPTSEMDSLYASDWVASGGYHDKRRLSSNGSINSTVSTTTRTSGYIPMDDDDVISIDNVPANSTKTVSMYLCAYDASKTFLKTLNFYHANGVLSTNHDECWYTKDSTSLNLTAEGKNSEIFGVTGIAYVRLSFAGEVVSKVYANKGKTEIKKEIEWYSFCDFVRTDRGEDIDQLMIDRDSHGVRLAKLEKGTAGQPNTRQDALNLIKTWDKPVYDQLEPFTLDHTLSVDSSRWVTHYDEDDKDGSKRRAQVTALYSEYDALCTEHPDFVRDITNVAHGVEGATETTYGGLCSDGIQSVKVYEFKEDDGILNPSNYAKSETKPKMILISGIHWEWGGVYALFHALKEITTNPALRYIRRNMHFIVMPVTNPYCFTNYGFADGRYNKNGVEIHNNFEVDFSNASDATHETAPLTEVETRYINNVMRKHSDAAYLVSAHSHQGDPANPTYSIWPSTATNYGCNLGFRLIDMMSDALATKYKTDWSGGNRAGRAGLSASSGTEAKQAMLYGIHGMSLEIGDTFYAFSEDKLSDYVITHGAETYINFIRIAMTAYSIHDRDKYAPIPAYEIDEGR